MRERAPLLLLDVDTGIDDTIALLYAALHPDVRLIGAGAVWGNVAVEIAARNTSHALAMAGLGGLPVAAGAAGPVAGGPVHYGYFVHGGDGQGNAGDRTFSAELVSRSAAEQIVGLARTHPGEIEIVAVGPMTNVALALGLCPELPSLVRGLTMMGGAAFAPGNRTPVAEANIWHDPEAAKAVFAASWPVTVVPLDVTMRTLLTERHRQRLLDAGGIASYVGRMLDFYFDYFRDEAFAERSSCIHDVLAVAVAAGTLMPDLAPTVNATVDDGDGLGRGQTIFDLRGCYRGYPKQRGAHCRVVLEANPQFVEEVVELLCSAGPSRIMAAERAGV
ncbi:MAG TPA: nucleoside hydrolase [Solirubrobacteraceae bacterium]